MWAIDLVTLLTRGPDLAWERVVSRAREWNVAWAVAPLVSWASQELAVPVPASAQAELDRAARWSGVVPRLRLRGARAADSARRRSAARA